MNANQNNPMMGAGQPPMQNGFNPNNQVFNMFGGYQNFMNGFNAFAQQMQQDPRQQAQQLMSNGQMSQQQFEWCRQMANMITGKNL
jgi:hypothetical protein